MAQREKRRVVETLVRLPNSTYHAKRIRAGGGSLWEERGPSPLLSLRWVRLSTGVKGPHGLAAKGTLSLRISVAVIALGVSCAIVSARLSPRGTMSKGRGVLPVPQGDASIPSCGDAPLLLNTASSPRRT